MFLRDDHGLELAGGTAARSLRRSLAPAAPPSRGQRWRDAVADIDWTPDLGARIGSRGWWRGLATCTALCTATWFLSPGLRPVLGDVPPPLTGAEHEEARALGVAPLAWGSDTGRRMAAGDLVVALAEAPERPSVELAATLGEGDDLGHMLERAGVGRADAAAAARLIGSAVPTGDIAPGTRVALTLGRRPSKLVPRPLDALQIRARFDLALTLARGAGGLAMTRKPIAVDHTPWRLQGLVGSSLYRSLRAAGAPARAAEGFIKALATRLSVGRDINAADSYDLVVERARAATGETRLGDLVFAALDQGSKRTRLVRWTQNGREEWFDADGQTERRGEMGMPVAGHITSSYGLRFHPILGFSRMHKGIDIGAPRGSPVHAVVDGRVASAGWNGGYGNFIKLSHSPSLMTGYGHLSRIAVRPGQVVRRGEVIGFVGSTGISTGPHLHWEVWKNGVAVNPQAVSFDSIAQLSGEALRRFKARVASLMAVTPGR